MRCFRVLPLFVLVVSCLLTSMSAEATPAFSTISNRGLLTLTDPEWDALWQIQQQCQEVTEGRRTSTVMEIDVPRLLGQNEWSRSDFGIEPVVAMTVYDHVESQVERSLRGRIVEMLESHLHRIMNTLHFSSS